MRLVLAVVAYPLGSAKLADLGSGQATASRGSWGEEAILEPLNRLKCPKCLRLRLMEDDHRVRELGGKTEAKGKCGECGKYCD